MANLSILNNLGLNASTGGGPIVGDHPDPYQFVTLPTSVGGGTTLTTGTLSAGDAGEFGNCTDATIEFWFNPAGAVSANGTIVAGPEISAGVRQWVFEFLTTTSLIRFTVRNSVPTTFQISSTTALQPGTWYHVVGAVDSTGGLVRLYINGVQQASTAWTPSIHVSSFSATAGDMRVGMLVVNQQLSFAALATYTRFIGATRIAAHYTAGASTGIPQQMPGERIGDILDISASVHAPRSLYAGSRIVTASYFVGQAPLDELRKAVAAENVDAMLFIGASGEWTFLDAGNRSGAPYNTVQSTFGDAGGTELPYLDLTVDESDSFLFNEWNVTREQGVKFAGDLGETKTATDATSVSRYFTRPAALSDVPVTTDTDTSAIATAMLAKYKEPAPRITSITLNTLDANTAQEVFRRELGDKIRVLRTPPGGGARIQEDLWIQKIDIAGANDGAPWSVRFGVSPV
jgi:hypothetical protein